MTANALESSRSTSPDTRVAVLSSNVGGHVQALLEHRVVGQWIALVVAERPDAYALRHAQWHGVPGVALHAGKSYLDLYHIALVRLLEERAIDYVVVAGLPRIVGTKTVKAYEDRIVKVHHSLLQFPGPDPVADALELGVKETGDGPCDEAGPGDGVRADVLPPVLDREPECGGHHPRRGRPQAERRPGSARGRSIVVMNLLEWSG